MPVEAQIKCSFLPKIFAKIGKKNFFSRFMFRGCSTNLSHRDLFLQHKSFFGKLRHIDLVVVVVFAVVDVDKVVVVVVEAFYQVAIAA